MGFFVKTVETELERLEALLARQEARIQQAFAQFVREAKSEQVVRRATELLERGDIESALRLAESYIRRLASVLPTVYQQAATFELGAIAEQIAPIAPGVAVSFDPTDTRAAMLIGAETLRFIREFSEAQRTATRAAIQDAFTRGTGTQGMARAFRDSIGLTRAQERAVARYRALLDQGSTQALDRALRDRRFDGAVRRAAASRTPLKPEQIDRMVERYRARYLAYRAENIARTEGVRAVSQARELAMEQNMADAGISPHDVEQTWRTTMDGRERYTHGQMNGQVRPFGQAFESPSGALLRWPGDPLAPIDETAQCRCQRTFRIKTSAGQVAV